ncbi:MAG: hypothetical protein EPO21_06705 [Chloroflexota bacterium]|nr:MAG: hypothetical protein EPO21_06705 [Chloroflexota bacterium]
MPYIDQKARPEMDSLMDPLIDHIKSLPLEQQDAVLDYVLTRMLMSLYHPPFFNFNRALGVLTAVTQEYYRVVIAPYEDEKIRDPGPVRAKPED